jgi:hypothetical protein
VRTRAPGRGTFDTAGRSGGALRPPAGVQGAEPPCKAHQPVGHGSTFAQAAQVVEALEDIEAWIWKFRAAARITLDEQPQLLEKLGVVTRTARM